MENILDGFITVIVVLLIILIFWFIPIFFGIKWAKIKGISKLWMLFGFHPVTGWIAFLIIRFGVDPKKQCDRCKESIIMEALVCRYCGNEMTTEDINNSKKEYEKRKNRKKV